MREMVPKMANPWTGPSRAAEGLLYDCTLPPSYFDSRAKVNEVEDSKHGVRCGRTILACETDLHEPAIRH
jgi:hypothetical protein